MSKYVKQLTQLARAYAQAECKVVGAFFAKPRKKTDHVRWLRAQAFKEYSAIKPILMALGKLYPEIDRGIHRHDFQELTYGFAVVHRSLSASPEQRKHVQQEVNERCNERGNIRPGRCT